MALETVQLLLFAQEPDPPCRSEGRNARISDLSNRMTALTPIVSTLQDTEHHRKK